jgi:tetratricopeptide (TPR) repeat protein
MTLTPLQQLARSAVRAKNLETFVAAKRSSFAPETVAELKGEVDRLVKTDLTKAEPLASATHRIGEILGDAVSLAYGEAALAQAHHYSGRLGLAEPLYRSAIERLRAARRRVEAAAIELQLVGFYHRRGQTTEALEVARKARRVLARAGRRDLLGQLETNVGALYSYSLSQYRVALKYFDRAKAIFEPLGDRSALAIVEYNRAHALVELDRPLEALDLYERAEEINLDLGRSILAAQCSLSLAYTLTTLGRYGEALQRFYASREKFLQAGDKPLAAWSAMQLAELHRLLNVVDEASSLAEQALDEFSQIEGHEIETARARVLRAKLLQQLQDIDGAEAEVVAARNALDEQQDCLMPVAKGYLAHAEISLARGDAESAEQHALAAERLFRRARLSGWVARARLLKAEAAHGLGRPGESLRIARSVVRAARRTLDPWLECRAESFVGARLLELNRRKEAVASLERAVDGIERLRSRLRPGEARATFLTDKLAPYERLVDLNLSRGDVVGMRAAFRYVEMAKSRALADLMAHHLATSARAGEAESHEAETKAQLAHRLQELTWYTSRIDDHNDKGDTRNSRLDTHLRKQLARCESQLASLFRRLEIENSPVATLLAARPVELDEISGELASDEVMVEFFVVDNRVSAFAITREDARVHANLTEIDVVEKLAAGFRFQVEKFALGSGYARAHGAALRKCADNHLEILYDLLIAPIEEQIEGRRLVVIPHGSLHYVPIHALKDRSGRYLVERAEVAYAPSATVHRLCANRPTPNGTSGLLAVGLGDERTPHITAELAALEELFPGSLLLRGELASKAAFLESAPRHRFLHLATHGYFRQDNPLFSSVKLVDGPLNFYDVFDLSLDAELVTLSACNTGLNKLAPGDELSGLMRGFLYAGAPSLLVSLWAVNDESTSKLMSGFYGHVQAGQTKRAALRLAQLEALEQYGHPYYWAPFILMGKP